MARADNRVDGAKLAARPAARLRVARKVARLLRVGRRRLATGVAAAALSGCAGTLARPAPTTCRNFFDPEPSLGERPDRERAASEDVGGEGRPAPDEHGMAGRVGAQVATRMPAHDAAVHRRLTRAIVAEARRARLDPLLVLAVIHVESSFEPHAVSSAGAVGLMQLREPTMRGEVARWRLPSADRHDPVANVQAGVRYLRRLLDAFGDLDVALMAYNAGPERIRRCQLRGALPERYRLYARKVNVELVRLRGDRPRRGQRPGWAWAS